MPSTFGERIEPVIDEEMKKKVERAVNALLNKGSKKAKALAKAEASEKDNLDVLVDGNSSLVERIGKLLTVFFTSFVFTSQAKETHMYLSLQTRTPSRYLNLFTILPIFYISSCFLFSHKFAPSLFRNMPLLKYISVYVHPARS